MSAPWWIGLTFKAPDDVIAAFRAHGRMCDEVDFRLGLCLEEHCPHCSEKAWLTVAQLRFAGGMWSRDGAFGLGYWLFPGKMGEVDARLVAGWQAGL